MERVERVLSESLAQRVGQRVRVVGWLQSLRKLGGISFAVVRDATGVVQAVVDAAALAALGGAQAESVIAVTGEVCAEPKAPHGVELRELAIELVSPASEPPPVLLGKKLANVPLPALLDHAVVANRFPQRVRVPVTGAGNRDGLTVQARRPSRHVAEHGDGAL